MLYVLIFCLVMLLALRFLYLGKKRDRFKMAATTFGEGGVEPLILQKEKECLVIVTDPIGDSRIGASACVIAKQIIEAFFETQTPSVSPHGFLKKACFLAHRGISEQMNANSGGCSIALIYLNGKQLNYASVGDVGIYVCDDELKRLNPLDLYKYQLRHRVLERKISEEQLTHNPLRNELTAYLGHEHLKKVNLNDNFMTVVKKDTLLIMTKAIYDVVAPLEVERILFSKGTPGQKMDLLAAIYHEQKPAHERKKLTASAVMMAQFK